MKIANNIDSEDNAILVDTLEGAQDAVFLPILQESMNDRNLSSIEQNMDVGDSAYLENIILPLDTLEGTQDHFILPSYSEIAPQQSNNIQHNINVSDSSAMTNTLVPTVPDTINNHFNGTIEKDSIVEDMQIGNNCYSEDNAIPVDTLKEAHDDVILPILQESMNDMNLVSIEKINKRKRKVDAITALEKFVATYQEQAHRDILLNKENRNNINKKVIVGKYQY